MPSHYRYSFTRPDGALVRVDIAPPSDSTGLAWDTSPTALQDDAIVGFDELTWEYDKYPVGMHSTPSAMIHFDANRIPSELLGWLCDAHITASAFQLDTAVGIANAVPTLSTIIRVTHNLPGSAGWQVAGIYVVDPSARVKPGIDGIVRVAVIDALVASLKQITFTMMRDVDWQWAVDNFGTEVTTKTAVIEWCWKQGPGASAWAYIANVVPGDNGSNQDASTIWAVSIETLLTRWDDYASVILAKMIRKVGGVASAPITNVMALVTESLYKQSYATTAGVGSLLSAGDIQSAAFITNDDMSTADLTISIHDELDRSYPSLWDFVADVVKSHYRQGAIVWEMAPFGVDDAAEVVVTRPFDNGIMGLSDAALTETSFEHDVALQDRIMGRAVSSWEYAVDDDYDTMESKTGFSRNDGEFTFPITFNSAPVATGYQLNDDNSTGQWDRVHATQVSITVIDYAFQIRLLGLYYLENPNVGGTGSGDPNAFDSPQLIRCHSWRAVYNAPDTPPTAPTSMGYTLSVTTAIGGRARAIADQQESGLVYLIAEKAKASFANYNSATATFKADITAGQNIDATYAYNNHLLPFTPNLRRISMDFTVKAMPYLTGQPVPTVWYPTKCTADILAGTMDVECWGVP